MGEGMSPSAEWSMNMAEGSSNMLKEGRVCSVDEMNGVPNREEGRRCEESWRKSDGGPWTGWGAEREYHQSEI